MRNASVSSARASCRWRTSCQRRPCRRDQQWHRRSLAPLLRPFGCRIAAYDPWLSRRYLETEGIAAAPLETVLAESRFVFILAGVTTENEGFLDRAKLELIGEDAAVVLASRAEVRGCGSRKIRGRPSSGELLTSSFTSCRRWRCRW